MIRLPNCLLVSQVLYNAMKANMPVVTNVAEALSGLTGMEIRVTPMLPMRFRVTREMRRRKRWAMRQVA